MSRFDMTILSFSATGGLGNEVLVKAVLDVEVEEDEGIAALLL